MSPNIVEQIHNEFDTASLNTLTEVKTILSKSNHDKAARLLNVGFKMAKGVEIIKDADTAKSIEDYFVRYPNNKFITEDQVKNICKKYRLVCAPISRYKGFVPELKLKQIESFSINSEDLRERVITNLRRIWSRNLNDGDAKKVIKNNYPNGIPASMVNSFGGINLPGISRTIYIESYDEVDNTELYICAPTKDIDKRGLFKIGNLLASVTQRSIPDPVVLQPVKHGFLIVAAWGDEASDENVVNEKMN